MAVRINFAVLTAVLGVLFFVNFGANAEENPLISVESGTVKGSSHLKTAKGRTIYSFEGIPYARPPVGKYRFREPQPPKPWRGIWDGRKQGDVCLQYDHMVYLSPLSIVGDEDCLFINVYTPKLPQVVGNKLLDVIVYIHGGGYTSGSGNLYGPKFLLDQDFVFVTFNYRLGPLGFLSTEDQVVPGNNGLKDQQFALAWVQRNIKSFGGNPASVTISGMSAGGGSVQYHYFSKKSAGLFHRGISMSGATLCPFPQVENSREKANRIGAELGCPTQSSQELIDCLRSRPARRIVRLIQPLFMVFPTDFVADADILKELDERWLELAPHVLDFNFTIPLNLQKDAAIKIKKEYLGDQPISRQTNRQLTHMFGDRLYVVDVERAARLQAAVTKSPVYFYRFAYRGKHSYSEMMSGGSLEDFGVSHGDDTMYVLETFYGKVEETESDKAMTQRMLDFWTSFAKTGNPESPGITWEAVVPNKAEINYLQIDAPDKMYMTTSEDIGRRKFWETLPFNEKSYTTLQPRYNKDEL
ncbi:venom carboxylesterase-6 [Nilaparvata lugens]|uniref:venom carboxylesterase-6 n=1 Tax=Nilaparvata lugens TaxID=108931 RepID=UPI00193E17AA|nr:venom carboxylesterase-6 [Nilaparvata lugens]